MKYFPKYLATLLTGLIVVSLSSCTAPIAKRDSSQFTSLANPTPAQKEQSTPASVSPNVNTTASSKNTVTVTIYQVDSQCQDFVSTKQAVPSDNQVEAAVGEVLARDDTADFSVAGYRVSVNPTSGVASVDLRLSPDSKRKFTSLSPCEQFAVFGSLRKTLTSNPTWKIKDVHFTEQGKEFYL